MVGVKAVKGVFGFGASLFDRVFDKFFLRKLAVAVEVGVVKFGLDRSLQLFLNFFRGSRRFYGKLGKGRTGGKDCSRGGNNKFFH